MNLDSRLGTVAAMVRQGSRMADIGTDHGRLPVWLLTKGVCPSAVAADLRPGPAAAARRTVREAGLADRIEVRIGDGLSVLAPGEAEDIVIAGMGGETIAAILAAAPWVKNPGIRLVLQPMSRPEELRRFLLTEGFAIGEERVAFAAGKWYTALWAVAGGIQPAGEEALFYVGKVPPLDGAPYLQAVSGRLRRQAAGLRRSAARGREAEHWERLARRVDEYRLGGWKPWDV